MNEVVGIDSSTQSCKAVRRTALGDDGTRRAVAPHPDGTEVDPEAWWCSLLDAVSDAGGLEHASAISVAGQQHGMVALDAQGEVIRPALLWNDTRSAAAAGDLIEEFGAAEFAMRTGSVPVASFTLTKLRWLRDAEPENARKVAAVALPHDWLTWRLRGFGPDSIRGPRLDELTTDRSDASGTSYWNPTTGEYDLELIEAGLGHVPILPRVLGPAEPAGHTEGARGLPDGLIIAAGAGDNAAAALGLNARAGDVVVSIGTSGTIYAISSVPTHDVAGLVAGFADASGEFLPLVATLNAARVLEVISRLLGVSLSKLSDLALEAPPASGGMVLQPYFEGERTPNLPGATATLFGMTLKNTSPSNLARAAVEGLLCGLTEGLDAIRAQGLEAKRIMLIGGAAQSAAVGAVAAQVFDVPVEVPQPHEYVAMGAAAQAKWAESGSRPDWSIELQRRLPTDPHPQIRQAFRTRQSLTPSSGTLPLG